MHPVSRIVAATLAFALGYALIAGLLFRIFAPLAPDLFRTATGLACALLTGAAAWRATANPLPGLGTAMMQGAGIVGAIGFAGGFFGPMLLAPEANQGPLVGIFITGPGGVLLGAVGGAVRWLSRRSAGRQIID